MCSALRGGRGEWLMGRDCRRRPSLYTLVSACDVKGQENAEYAECIRCGAALTKNVDVLRGKPKSEDGSAPESLSPLFLTPLSLMKLS